MRTCSGCTLCCKLLPMHKGADAFMRGELVPRAVNAGLLTIDEAIHTMPDFEKPAGERCKFQRMGKGCTAYANRPFGCRFWNCRWLAGDVEVAHLRRPDRTHYVIDIDPDFVRTDSPDKPTVPVIQIWVDPDYPDAHRDPDLRLFLAEQGEKGICALIRFSAAKSIFLVPPAMSHTGDFFEKNTGMCEEVTHTFEEKMAVLGPYNIVLDRGEWNETLARKKQ